jgi:sulfate adenylyltransferase large subunit
MGIAQIDAVASLSAALQAPVTRKLLRFTTAGSVDDGKSTLIGRLLYDSHAVYEDQLASVCASRINRSSGPIDFSLLTDGLRAEREQGITIDVAYRYFSTARRKFIIADTPGHEQYTRNMVTGASTADVAVILVDSIKGLLSQSRRHAYIASLLGVTHVIAAINKMDLVGYSQRCFEDIAADFHEYAETLGFKSIYALPLNSVNGDNVVRRSARTPWFDSPALLEYLEDLELEHDLEDDAVRFAVQSVIRPNSDFRGFAGELASGVLRRGDTVRAFPSGRKTHVKSIVTYDGELEEAHPGEAITLTLQDELDVSRGDLLVTEKRLPSVSRSLEATLIWMHERPLDRNAWYLLKHTTRTVRARISSISGRVDVNTLVRSPAATLNMNDIASVEIESSVPLFFDSYRRNRSMGSFILIDPSNNATVAAGIIEGATNTKYEQASTSVRTNRPSAVTPAERRRLFGHGAAGVWITGSLETVELVERSLLEEGWRAHRLRPGLSQQEWVACARVFRDAGMVALWNGANGAEHLRDRAAQLFGQDNFFLFDERGESPAQAAANIVRGLREWRDANGLIGGSQ